MFLGLASLQHENGDLAVAISMHDSTYTIDFSERHFPHTELEKFPRGFCEGITEFVITTLGEYQHEHRCKFLGAGLERALAEDVCPGLSPALWLELDIVPIVFSTGGFTSVSKSDVHKGAISADEEADAVARKCVMY